MEKARMKPFSAATPMLMIAVQLREAKSHGNKPECPNKAVCNQAIYCSSLCGQR